MKFCRNLQRVIDISDPEWAPYWTNYKMLKKFLKALIPPDNNNDNNDSKDNSDVSENDEDDINIDDACVVKKEEPDESQQQQDDDEKEEESPPLHDENTNTASTIPTTATTATGVHNVSSAAQMKSNPAEVTFFKLLNSELKKAIHFFDKATIEFGIREERVREGIDIMRKTNSIMVNERWSLMARSLYRLYKDLLLLETYAIMTYCSFSKILKKHDKVTNHNTRCAFMTNVVNKANFTHYPKLLEMIARIEQLYDEVSQSLVLKGKSGLYEDERLFIGMIQKLNDQVLDTAEQEGAPDTDERKKSRSSFSPLVQSPPGTSSSRSSMEISSEAQRSNLRSLVEENELNKSSKDGLVRVPEIEKVTSSSNSDEKKKTLVEKEKKHQLVDDSLQPSAKRSKSEP